MPREAGYKLVLAARSKDKLEALAQELGRAAGALRRHSWEDQQQMAAAALERFGRIDVVFANAGFGAPRGFLESTPEHWQAMVLTNVYGAALTIRATLPARARDARARAADRARSRAGGRCRVPSTPPPNGRSRRWARRCARRSTARACGSP